MPERARAKNYIYLDTAVAVHSYGGAEVGSEEATSLTEKSRDNHHCRLLAIAVL